MLFRRFFVSGMFCFVFCLAPCSPSSGVVVIKKPGGSETVFDMGGDCEPVSSVDEEKYALVFFLSCDYKYVAVTYPSNCYCHCVTSLIFLIVI